MQLLGLHLQTPQPAPHGHPKGEGRCSHPFTLTLTLSHQGRGDTAAPITLTLALSIEGEEIVVVGVRGVLEGGLAIWLAGDGWVLGRSLYMCAYDTCVCVRAREGLARSPFGERGGSRTVPYGYVGVRGQDDHRGSPLRVSGRPRRVRPYYGLWRDCGGFGGWLLWIFGRCGWWLLCEMCWWVVGARNRVVNALWCIESISCGFVYSGT